VRYLLDTTFAIDFLRSRPDALARMERLVANGDEPFVNDVVACELATGVRPSEEAGLDAFIAGVEYVQPGPDVALRAGRWRAAARRRGMTLSVPDALIGATAEALDATVLTRNARDFGLTPVVVETY
jgi:predicted nucleic acid-binding protein